jgi:hypothetical protein
MLNSQQIEDTQNKRAKEFLAREFFSRVEIINPNARKSKEPDFTLS